MTPHDDLADLERLCEPLGRNGTSAAFMSAVNPATVLAMIHRIRELKEAATAYFDSTYPCEGNDGWRLWRVLAKPDLPQPLER